MNKKILVSILAVVILAFVHPADAQQARKVHRIGILISGSVSSANIRKDAFRQGLRELGYVEGQNIVIEYRYAEGKADRFPDLAADLVRLNVDVIVTVSTPGVLAARKATGTIPIVFVAVNDPVASGVVASLAHPGGNVTGLSTLASELGGKKLELLKEAFPKVTRVAHLWNPDSPTGLSEMQAAAHALGLQLQSLEVRSSNDFDSAFEAVLRERAHALITSPNPVVITHHKRIVEFAAERRLPAIYYDKEFVEAGGLMSYGPDYSDLYRRAATYVDKILKGAKPAELPVEQPTKFELVINLKTAKQIGLTIPDSILYRADKVIR